MNNPLSSIDVMKLVQAESLSETEIKEVFEIWNKVYPKQIAYKDLSGLESTLDTYKNPTHFMIKNAEQMMGWCCVFDRQDARWFALIIDGEHQCLGLGTRLLNIAKDHETELFGWMTPRENYVKTDGSVYRSPQNFYIKHGFVITEESFETEVLYTVKIAWKKRVESWKG